MIHKNCNVVVAQLLNSSIAKNSELFITQTLGIRTFSSNKVGIKMDSKSIYLNTDLTVKGLRDHLFKFIRTQKFQSDFVYFLTKASIADSFSVITLGQKTLVNLNNKDEIKSYVDLVTKYFINHKDQYYPKANDILIFNYLETNKTSYDKIKRNKNLLESRKFDNIIIEGLNSPYDIPFNTDYNSWGNLKRINITKSEITNIVFNDAIQLIEINHINNSQTYCKVHIKDTNKTITFTDVDTKRDLDNIKRFYNESGVVVYFDQNVPFFSFDSKSFAPKYDLDKDGKETNRRSDVIQPIRCDKEIKFNYLTLDIETYLDDIVIKNKKHKIHKLLCLCYNDYLNESDNYSYYIGDYNSTTDLLKAAFDNLLTENFNKKYVYIHNGANFDLYFLTKYLLSRTDILLEPLYKDGKFISINIRYGKIDNKNGINIYKYSICIRDSIMLLPLSLAKLGKSFNVNIQKDIFPYSFPNVSNFNYEGVVPAYEFFDSKKVSLADYNDYIKRFQSKKWNLKVETLNYCNKDCISLYLIIKLFAELIYNKFNVNLFECPTLPSLAFRIFRAKFLKKNLIPILGKEIYDELVNAYFGGHVDLYYPKGPKVNELSVQQIRDLNLPKLIEEKGIDYIKANFKTIKHYDVNALYPSVMLNRQFPTDILGKFIGDITKISDYSHYYKNNLGIYKVKVTAPDIENPILPFKLNNQVVYPYGSWTGWYFSEEIKNSENYGYKFEILGGYIFDSEILFANYIKVLNAIKESSNKTSAMYLISKLLLNSLYGKMGISPHLNNYSFYTKDSLNQKMNDDKFKEEVKDWVDFDNHYLVGVENPQQHIYGNVGIALAVTAYSRIVMSGIKNNPNIKLFYSDTDSAFVDNYLPAEMVDAKKIGLFKLESEYLLFIGIGPKVYGAIDIYGNEYTKVKGFKNKIDLKILESLLNKCNSANLLQEKWFKNMNNSAIIVKVSPYDLKPNNNKRICIYEKDLFVSTKSVSIANFNSLLGESTTASP